MWPKPVLAFVTVLALTAPGYVAAADEPVDLELVLAVDISGSIDAFEARLQRQGYMSAIVHPRVIGAIESGFLQRIAVTYFEWGGDFHQRTIVGWTVISDAASARAFASALAEMPIVRARRTSISAAIDYAVPLFENNGYEGTRRVIDVSGDGYNNIGRPVIEARDAAVATGITINGLPIINDRPNPFGRPPPANLDTYYENYVIGGPGSFLVVAVKFDNFAQAILSKLIREIAAAAPVDVAEAD
ncbi:MAG: DUF1194 domain-containing protein [Alphaproteobacteria bacterium]